MIDNFLLKTFSWALSFLYINWSQSRSLFLPLRYWFVESNSLRSLGVWFDLISHLIVELLLSLHIESLNFYVLTLLFVSIGQHKSERGHMNFHVLILLHFQQSLSRQCCCWGSWECDTASQSFQLSDIFGQYFWLSSTWGQDVHSPP